MMKASLYRFSGATIFALLAMTQTASASWLDNDYWCRVYGCAVAHDGREYIIYDVAYVAPRRCCVPVGSPLAQYEREIDDFHTNVTGSLSAPSPPTDSQGFHLGLSGGGRDATPIAFDDGDGFLDADDTMLPFGLDNSAKLTLSSDSQSYSHSFYVTSRNTRFSLRGRANVITANGDFRDTISLSDIGISISIEEQGRDDGRSFGDRANPSNISVNPLINDLGDVASATTTLINFDNATGIRGRNGDLTEQTVRIDFTYTMPEYDMSMGIGELDLEMIFDFYREA